MREELITTIHDAIWGGKVVTASCGDDLRRRNESARVADAVLTFLAERAPAGWEPSAINGLVSAANAVLAANPQDDTMWSLEAAVRPFNASKPKECDNGCPAQQVCDYCQIAAPPSQPVVVKVGNIGEPLQPVARTCTCHPDDNPPRPCAQQYALDECRAAAPEVPRD